MESPISTPTSRPLRGQLALITGASSGIGQATALTLAALGADTVVHYRSRRDLADTVVHACQQHGVRSLAVQADLAAPDGAEALVCAACELGKLSILVNNAGSTLAKLFLDTTPHEWHRVLADNLTSAYLCTRLALPVMLAHAYGRVVNVSSVFGLIGGANEAAYSAAKGGLIAMTKAVAKEVARSNITVNAVAPGAIATAMTNNLSHEDVALVEAEIPVGRMGTPAEVASLIGYLCSPQAAYVTGQVISPNGGWVT